MHYGIGAKTTRLKDLGSLYRTGHPFDGQIPIPQSFAVLDPDVKLLSRLITENQRAGHIVSLQTILFARPWGIHRPINGGGNTWFKGGSDAADISSDR